jgi:DNA integrity scanning protein DisA with diadenylate cyclase activity
MEYELNIKDLTKQTITDIAIETKVECILTIVNKRKEEYFDFDIFKELDNDTDEIIEQYIIQVFREDKPAKEYEYTKTKTLQFNRIIDEILSDAIKKGYVKKGMRVLIVTDSSINKKYSTSIMVVEVDKKIYRIGKFNLAEKLSSETIIETIIEIAQELGIEGREGKKVGTLFVIGDNEELKPYCRQLILNPFKGYEKDLLNIIQNNNLSETIKNFAQLDGAFIIDQEGTLLSAGTYLDVDTSNIKPYQGWGTKHLAATAITKETSAVAVLVSESGGAVKVFKNGRLVLKLK